ncbi:TMAO reductase system periplasmic protein TorT [Thalassotalea atypica]|uniref:TMAO reductase system periplasmic protein TorT n=1 Tax=Thalassotalea atypica TaxID=2054316 RepID=UPI002573664E|nr:TMAO reductase system periplasmic protein TorT [Thalassotalea atypica]
MKKLFVLLLVAVPCFFSVLVAANPVPTHTNSKIKLCAVYPHLKDSYWLSINFGMTEQAKQSSIALKVLEAGGYQNADEQFKQIEQCIEWQANAILVGTVSFEQLNLKLAQVNQHTPIFALVNEVATKNITGRTGVSWYQMGFNLGQYLVNYHQQHGKSESAQLAWFPGPKGGGGSLQSTQGLKAAIANSAIELVTVQHGLNEKITQFSLLKNTFKKFTDIEYLAGNAVMAEMAINEVSKLPKAQRPKILSHYFSHGVYRGIKRNKILMANSDQMVHQGRMAINQAVTYLQTGKSEEHQATAIITIDQQNIDEINTQLSLSPNNFKPVYNVKPLAK